MEQQNNVDAAPYVLTEISGAVATITMNRGAQFNALSEQMIAALHEELVRLGKDGTARICLRS